LACVFGFSRISHTAGISTQVFSPPPGLDVAEVSFYQPHDEPRAILVLCPGENGNGRELIKRAEWRSFAEKEHLLLVGIHFESPHDLLFLGKGYFYAEQGSGNLLLKAIDNVCKKTLPILMYGSSGGAHFVSSFANWHSERVIAWCAYSAGWWEPPHTNVTTNCGIIACGEADGVRYDASLAYFRQGRALGKHWTWVSLMDAGHEWSPALEAFSRFYFAAVVNQQAKGIWYDVMKKTSCNGYPAHPTLAVWLPNADVAKVWCSLHDCQATSKF